MAPSTTDVFAALADPVRRSLLRALRTGPRRVVDLADGLPISRPAVSKHLRLLVEAGLVEAEERGRERHYALRRSGLAPLTAYVEGLLLPAPLTPTRWTPWTPRYAVRPASGA